MLLTGASRRGAATLAASGPDHTVRATRSAVNGAAPAAADAENLQEEVGSDQARQSVNFNVCHKQYTARESSAANIEGLAHNYVRNRRKRKH